MLITPRFCVYILLFLDILVLQKSFVFVDQIKKPLYLFIYKNINKFMYLYQI